MKKSDNPNKTTDPGDKRLIRFFDKDDCMIADMISHIDEPLPKHKQEIVLHHPKHEHISYRLHEFASYKDMLVKVMSKGRKTKNNTELSVHRAHALEQLKKLDPTFKRLLNPHIYKVSLSERLYKLKSAMLSNL